MDIPVVWLNSLFLPYDLKHLLLVWAVMTALLFVAFMIVSSSGIYTSRRSFWSVLLGVLAGAYLLTGTCFLIFHLNVILTIMIVVCLAFVVLGDVGFKEKETPSENWWLSLLVASIYDEPDTE